jgi:hypothetical protein
MSVWILEVRDVVRAVDRVRLGEKRDAAFSQRVVRGAYGRNAEDDFDRLGALADEHERAAR